jgi:hypothetical protein
MKAKKLLNAFAIVAAVACGANNAYADDSALSFAIDVTEVSASDFKFTITPSDDEATYYFYATPIAKFEKIGGLEGAAEFDLAFWQQMANLYGVELSSVVEANLIKGTSTIDYAQEYGKKTFWDSEYVIYCYGLNADGTLTTSVVTKEVKTLSPEKSDNTFDIEVTSIDADPDSKYYVYVNATITPSKDDEQYLCAVHNQSTLDWYYEDDNALTPEDPEKDYIATELINANLQKFTGKIDTQTRVRINRDYIVSVVGYSEEGPTTELFTKGFTASVTTGVNSISTGEGVAVKGGLGEITIAGNYDQAAIFTLDGKAIKVARGAAKATVAPGCYIVRVNANGTTKVSKVLVK